MFSISFKRRTRLHFQLHDHKPGKSPVLLRVTCECTVIEETGVVMVDMKSRVGRGTEEELGDGVLEDD